MSFNRPTPKEILRRLEVEINATFPGADARLPQSVEAFLARIIAMASHEMFGYLDYISKQILPSTAEEEFLHRHGTTWRVLRKTPSPASGFVTFHGANGSTIQAGSILLRADNVEYVLDEDTTINAGNATATVTAITPGASGNAVIGVKMSLVSPVAGVQSEAVVADDGSGNGLTGGADIEPETNYRDRILDRIQHPPHGGAAHDFIAWALEVPGVTRAWVYPLQYGLGTVGLTFVMDNKAGSIIPSAGEVASVQNYINDRRLITSDITVFAPTPTPVDFEIHLRPNTIAVQNAIKAELEDFFRREAKPGGTLYLSRIQEAISTAVGEFNHNLTHPAGDVEMPFGEMPVVGAFTWDDLP